MERDSLDFRTMKVGRLFKKQLFPTMLGMVFSALFIITDGVFVGRGIGSDALAAVNIAAPLFVFAAGVGLMFGMGGAIIASINLAKEKLKVANINATQAIVVSFVMMSVISVLVAVFPTATARLLGAPEDILGLAREYLLAYALFAPVQTLLCVMTFFVRIDGPKVSMWCMTTSTVVNFVLDYLFIFEFGWGLTGAAVATGIGGIVGCLMMGVYLLRYAPRIRPERLKMSAKSLRLTARNSGYIIRLGFSAFLGEAAIAVMMFSGNYVFARYLGTNGVAAFSIACYLFPIIFMVFNAVIQSAQPIISYNYGAGDLSRSNRAFRLALFTACGFALFFFVSTILFVKPIISLFILDHHHESWIYATEGMPWFGACYLFFGINVVAVGYYMSIERVKSALLFTSLRGVILPMCLFFTLPLWLDVRGIWLAVPFAEAITSVGILIYFLRTKQKAYGEIDHSHSIHSPAGGGGAA